MPKKESWQTLDSRPGSHGNSEVEGAIPSSGVEQDAQPSGTRKPCKYRLRKINNGMRFNGSLGEKKGSGCCLACQKYNLKPYIVLPDLYRKPWMVRLPEAQ
ncbi:uncharacterized protein PV06_02262 [Exophiala oligosperma]|uniref:Uncharacterized protein n=1 Tax=Exophiala oligosperma TaxID=215243 RepID=A0A0D2C9V1_9EURO|nr:uncharacterized protein PV06_02262 [Exophiala oligosperma]KIW46597.1 hypothetical protein PV06_02262 [Exophiala oligosperma]